MKKITLFACFLLTSMVVLSQLTSNTGKAYTNLNGINYVFIFNGLTNSEEVTYNGSGNSLKWYKFTDSTPIYTGVNIFDKLEDNTGYILEEANGNKIYFWVIDYSKYISPSLYSIIPEYSPTTQCKELNLMLSSPPITYQSFDRTTYEINRNFNIKYKTLSWDDNSNNWKTIDTTIAVTLPISQVSIPVPYCNTTFTLSGDQYTDALNLTKISTTTSSEYTTNAVICHPTSVTTTRNPDATNEEDGPTDSKKVKGSAPMEILFLSNANEPVATFYRWEVFKNDQPLITRSDKDHRYSFTEFGIYKVKITASNNTCSSSDSIIVDISDSQLQIPNVFTPNGDGINDEFRVAYKSIISFNALVFNRWGRKVYSWTDPTKGWDGRIAGKDATSGPYFYVIKAVGSDGKKYLRKGDINLLR